MVDSVVREEEKVLVEKMVQGGALRVKKDGLMAETAGMVVKVAVMTVKKAAMMERMTAMVVGMAAISVGRAVLMGMVAWTAVLMVEMVASVVEMTLMMLRVVRAEGVGVEEQEGGRYTDASRGAFLEWVEVWEEEGIQKAHPLFQREGGLQVQA